MKKSILFVVSLLLVNLPAFSAPIEDEPATPPLKPAKESHMNLFADIGLASGDFSGMYTGIGFQYGFSPSLFGEALVEIYFNPMNSYVTNTAYAVNLNGVYKVKMSEEAKLFFKAGFSSTSLTASYMNYSLTSDNQIGLNAGVGGEIALNKKIGLKAGGTFKVIFDQGETLTFFNFNGGVYLNL
jgi:hypothetical protein